jgi:hypothetical protein
MLDLSRVGDHEFRIQRDILNSQVRLIDTVCRVIDGQPWQVAVYSTGIAHGARLGSVRENGAGLLTVED